jgi:hypothetical protein
MSDGSGSTGALLALWNDVAPEVEARYEDWHANEHVPERLGVPGMRWGRRWRAAPGTAGPRYLTLYGLRDARVLDSDAYRRLLSHPTPASAFMRPHLRNVSRWVCAVHRLDEPVLAADALALWTCDERNTVDGVADAFARVDGPALVAERADDAAPLPWLRAGQAEAVAGRWLFALGTQGHGSSMRESILPGARGYTALPVAVDAPSS